MHLQILRVWLDHIPTYHQQSQYQQRVITALLVG